MIYFLYQKSANPKDYTKNDQEKSKNPKNYFPLNICDIPLS